MQGTVIRLLTSVGIGFILADGEYFNCYDPRWINATIPRNGQYVFQGSLPLSVGERVTFDAQPGTILPGGTFETESIAVNVQPA